MIVIIIPYILIRERYHCFLFFNVNYFEALLLEISNGYVLIVDAERFAVSADRVVQNEVWRRLAAVVGGFRNLENLDLLVLFVLDDDVFVFHQGEGIWEDCAGNTFFLALRRV